MREEMNRADRLTREGEGRAGNMVGFALTVLQRRLASSPEAIYQSLKRRRERLEKRLRAEELVRRGAALRIDTTAELAPIADEDSADEYYSPSDKVLDSVRRDLRGFSDGIHRRNLEGPAVQNLF